MSRYYSTEGQSQTSHQQQEQPYTRPSSDPRNFVKKFLDNIQEEMKKNKELQENRKQLEEHMRKLGDSEVLRKFVSSFNFTVS